MIPIPNYYFLMKSPDCIKKIKPQQDLGSKSKDLKLAEYKVKSTMQ